jgi:DNA-binding response OmpR family regulator
VITNIGNHKSLARLLVVDDDLDIVQILKLGLQKNGFLVDEFSNPEGRYTASNQMQRLTA